MKYTLCHKPLATATDCLVLGCFTDDPLHPEILKSIYQDKLFSAELAKTMLLYKMPDVAAKMILLVGCGEKKAFTPQSFLKVIKQCALELSKLSITNSIICLPELNIEQYDTSWQAFQSILALESSQYLFTNFKSVEKPQPTLNSIQFSSSCSPEAFATTQAQALAVAAGMKVCRDLGNLPANICTPTYLATFAHQLAQQFPQITTSVLEEADMEQLNMGALLAVAKGSEQRAKLVILNYKGAADAQDPIVLVGKGITFDSGGISIKPALGMDEMKYDMCGAASVLGTLHAAAQLQLPLNIIGLLACAENLPSGQATKPGDIVKTHSGQTVEILNTDAEGRLVLCDVLSYVAKFKPRIVLDIATLTGAVIIALGHHITGILGNDEALIQELIQAGKYIEDKAWQLPITQEYQDALDSNFADIANVGNDRAAGSITAACFLSRFTEQYRWAHLDIAGTAWLSGKNKGATGRPVPLLTQFLLNQCK